MEADNSFNKEIATVRTNPDQRLRKIASIITWLVVLFIPTYAKVTTSPFYGPINETTFFLPWMILIRFQPDARYNSDQYTVVSFPWSIILFIPFMYVLKLSWDLFQNNDERVIKSSFIVLASILQIGLLGMTFGSQDIGISEEVSVYYVPQFILIILHGILASMWFYEETQNNLEKGKLRKERESYQKDISE